MTSSPDAPFYANGVRIQAGPFDVLLEFGYKAPSAAEAPEAQFEVRSRVAMSVAHAKTMIPMLASVIAAYEKEMGGVVPAPGFDALGGE